MCTFKITNNPNKIPVDDLLPLGGPTLSNNVDLGGVYVNYHLLSITGEITPQPVEREGKQFLLLGEIYNYDISLPSDIYFGIEKYLEYGDRFTEHLDGEFLFIVIDRDKIDFFTDPWSTRQCYYTEDDNWYFSTFRINTRSQRLLHNSHYRFYIESEMLQHVNNELIGWNLDQNVKSLDEVENAFTEAVLKKWYPNSTLFLSGGLDSGSVALCLSENKKPFNSISLMMYPDVEDQETLNEILKRCASNHYTVSEISQKYNTRKLTFTDGSNYPCIHPATYEIVFPHQAEIRKQTKMQFNSKVTLMGNGGDEILDNYRNKGFLDRRFEIWPDDLSSIFPWWTFYGGQTRQHLDFHETYNLNFGLELRNIFYDKKLAQAWLNVDVSIKNKEPKVFVKNYFRERQIPIPKYPVSGFGHQGPVKYKKYMENDRKIWGI